MKTNITGAITLIIFLAVLVAAVIESFLAVLFLVLLLIVSVLSVSFYSRIQEQKTVINTLIETLIVSTKIKERELLLKSMNIKTNNDEE